MGVDADEGQNIKKLLSEGDNRSPMIVVLRMGHRHERDKRLSTHVGLTARALGAHGVIFSGEKDEKMMSSVQQVVDDFGGEFSVKYHRSWKEVIRNARDHGFTIMHLTAYGMPLQQKTRQLRKDDNLLVIVGGEKVPKEVYHLADYNIAVGNQPHSEVAALALTLHEYYNGKELDMSFTGGKKEIIPQEDGKEVEESAV